MDRRDIDSRRQFLFKAASSIGLVLSAPVIASIISSCELDETIQGADQTYTLDVSTLPEIADVGTITTTTVDKLNGGELVFISHVAEDTYVVFSNVCTHQGCSVGLPENATDDCLCPCHLSVFSRTTGKVVEQPITGSATDLPSFPATFDKETGILTISGKPA